MIYLSKRVLYLTANVLLSYAYHQKTDLADVHRKLRCGQTMIDSGAFTAHTLGKQISLKEYAEYLQHWQGYWDHAITLDVIGDMQGTARNTRKLHEMGIPVMPVFTRGGKIADFDAMVKDVGYVCLGGMVGMRTSAIIKRVGMLQQRAESMGGGVHALGVGSTRMLRAARPYSADASNVSQAPRFGSLYYYNGIDIRSLNISDRPAMRRHADKLLAQNAPLASYIESGRRPSGNSKLAQFAEVNSYSHIAAAQHLLERTPVNTPRGMKDSKGLHMYMAMVPGANLDGVLDAAQRIHSSNPPRIWKQYGKRHKCRRKNL